MDLACSVRQKSKQGKVGLKAQEPGPYYNTFQIRIVELTFNSHHILVVKKINLHYPQTVTVIMCEKIVDFTIGEAFVKFSKLAKFENQNR